MARGRRTGGKEAKITLELVERVAGRIAEGLTLRHACALEEPPVTAQHFQAGLNKAPLLSARMDKIVGLFIQGELRKIKDSTCKTLPGSVWILERSHGYSTNKGGNTTVTVNNVCIGLADDISKRAAALVLASAKRAKAVEVQATVQRIEDKPSP